MSKQFDERLSALVDGEETQSNEVFSRIQQDDKLVRRWQRYHLISDAIKGHLDGASFPDISARVSQAIDSEPTILAPQRRPSRLQHWYKQAAGFAVAATVATVAVIGVQQAQLADNEKIQIVAINTPLTNVKHSQLDSAVEAKLSGYLVQHNEYSVASKMQGALPYMRIVSITPGKRIPNISDEK